MYIYRKRQSIKKDLVKEKIKRSLENKTCPSCSGHLELIEQDGGKQTFACAKCHSTNVFAALPPHAEKSQKETRLGAITVRDCSKQRKYDYKNQANSKQEVHQEVLETIRSAMSLSRLVQFEYRKGKDAEKRVVEPYKLALDGSRNMILYAYCTEGEGIRIFKLEKMEKIEVTEYEYKPKWPHEDKLLDEKGNST